MLTNRPGLPYFMFLKRQRHERGRDELGRPEFARLQREALENYLVGLIRAVVRLFLHVCRLSTCISPS